MQIVAVDVGNSSIKACIGILSREKETCVLDGARCHDVAMGDQTGPDLSFLKSAADWFVSSVNDANLQALKTHCIETGYVKSWHVIQRSEIPLELDLDQPDSAGIDRLLASLAAHRLYGKDCSTIVIDCGTAMTIDVVDEHSTFRGGLIMAGPATNLLALNILTEALPNLVQERLIRPVNVLGRNTREAMLNGAWYNGVGAIKEAVSAIQASIKGTPVVVGTGGGLGPWRDVLPVEWVQVEDLVLEGVFQVAIELTRESANERG